MATATRGEAKTPTPGSSRDGGRAATAKAVPRLDTPGIEAAEMFERSFHAAPTEKIEEIRRGVPAKRVSELSRAMDIPKESLINFLGLSRATLSRKVQKDQPLSREESERVVGIQALIGQVQAMVKQSGADAPFDAAKWVSRWLNEPLPALGGERPAAYMDTVEGQKLIANLLAMIQSGAYA